MMAGACPTASVRSASIDDAAFAIRLLGVGFTYSTGQQSVHALRDLTFDIEPHQFISIVGPSGCGKSTLLRILGGFLSPTSGSVEINDMAPAEARERSLVGMVFQTPVLLQWRDVLSNVAFLLELQGEPRSRRETRARAYIDLVGLTGFEHHRPVQLSGGMQQRASIARALVFDPSILLMDEPFGALDAITRDRMATDLLRIWKQERKTVVFVTHSVQEAVLLSDLIIVMTPRPGGIQAVHRVDFGVDREHRDRLDPEFIRLTRRLIEDLQGLPA